MHRSQGRSQMRTRQTETTRQGQGSLEGRRGALAWMLVLGILTLLALAPSASADLVFGNTQGPAAGQIDNPEAIALDPEAGLVYVADRANNRVDVFKTDGSFLRAFGWGVADGTTPALQTCTTTCFKGIGGAIPDRGGGSIFAGGAGEFSAATSIAVDNDPASPTQHDVYVADGHRIQRFSTDDNGTPANPADDKVVFEGAWGGGVISAGASGKGDLSAGSAIITNVEVSAKRFYLGQRITASGKIPAGTRIVDIGEGTITLSQPASASGAGVAISAPEGAGHVAVNEVQELFLEFNAGGGKYRFKFPIVAPDIGSSMGQPATKTITWTPGISAATIQTQLEELSNVGPGDVAVSGPAGGPYTVEFKGRYADTDVPRIGDEAGGEIKKAETLTVNNGASAAEVCTPANAADCSAGVSGKEAGQFWQSLQVATGPGGAIYVGDDLRSIGGEPGGDTPKPRLQTFEADGTPTGELLGINTEKGLVVESDGDFFGAGTDAVHKYDPAGTLLSTINPSTNLHAIATDRVVNLYVADNVPAETAIYEYDPAGNIVHTFYGNGTLLARPLSLAPYSDATGDIFALQDSGGGPRRIVHIAIEPPGPVVLPFTAQAGPGQESPFADTNATKVTNLSATLNTRVNPEGKASTVHFQYVDDASYQAEGFESAKTVTTPESASLGSDFSHHKASFEIPCAGPGQPGCLAANTVYHLRAVATNADGKDNGPEASFKTLPPITLGGIWSTEVSTDSARLHAALNPNGIERRVQAGGVGADFGRPDAAEGDRRQGFEARLGAVVFSIGVGRDGAQVIDGVCRQAARLSRSCAGDFEARFVMGEVRAERGRLRGRHRFRAFEAFCLV